MSEITVYTNIADVPLDTYDVPDAIDKPDHEKSSVRQLSSTVTPIPPKGFVIPYTHTISEGWVGKDVVGAKRAIWKANGLKIPTRATQSFGPTAVTELKKFQKKVGLTVDGQLGPETLKKLAPYFDADAFLLYVGYAPGTNPVLIKRNLFVAYMLWGYNNRVEIHYAEARPMDHLNDLKFLPVYDDCSEFYTKGAKYAGWKDPNGLNYNGAGWTGTLGNHGRQITFAQIQPASAVLYGPAPDFTHVAGYVGSNRVVSHGSEIGPLLLDFNYRGDVAEYRDYVTS